jgi:hypothetical protein
MIATEESPISDAITPPDCRCYPKTAPHEDLLKMLPIGRELSLMNLQRAGNQEGRSQRVYEDAEARGSAFNETTGD